MNTKFKKINDIPEMPFSSGTLFIKMEPMMLLLVLLTLWCFAPRWLHMADETAGNIDQSIWLLVLLSMICFLLIAGLCWWLLNRFILLASLPSFSYIVSQFNTLTLWQQLSFYWGSFALLLVTALLSLAAVC